MLVMEAILANVETSQLEEGYKTFIGRVLRETEEDASEKEDTVLAESASDEEDILDNAELATGDDEDLMVENEEVEKDENRPVLSESTRESLRKLAGIK